MAWSYFSFRFPKLGSSKDIIGSSLFAANSDVSMFGFVFEVIVLNSQGPFDSTVFTV